MSLGKLKLYHAIKTGLWGISSAGRAPALHAGGQGFDPLILHQKHEYAARTNSSSVELRKMPFVP